MVMPAILILNRCANSRGQAGRLEATSAWCPWRSREADCRIYLGMRHWRV